MDSTLVSLVSEELVEGWSVSEWQVEGKKSLLFVRDNSSKHLSGRGAGQDRDALPVSGRRFSLSMSTRRWLSNADGRTIS